MSFLCRNIRFYVTTGNGHSMGSAVSIELAKARRNYVTTEQFYVTIELARVGRNSVTIEDFWVAIKLATAESSTTHDRVRHAKAGTYDSAISRYVLTKEAMRERRLGQACVTDQTRRA